jgi:NAD dependent epimerase/dehydratase family enzyme
LIQESITFPYVDCGGGWIDEHAERVYYWGTRSTVDAEAAAATLVAAGGVSVVLRFAMFMAPDSAHIHSFVSAARRGVFALFGAPEGFVSFVHADDAAAAVVAALSVPAGTYNVAEPDPVRRSDHRDALAAAVGRSRLRPVPTVVERAGGVAVAALARSQRISSQHLRDVSQWVPTVHCVDQWKEMA